MADKLFYTFVIFATIGMALAQFSGIEYVSPVFRVSPYGTCGISTLRPDAPCFTSTEYDFYNITTTGSQIKSMVVVPFQTATYYYLGMGNNQIWVVARNSANQFSFIQYATAPTSNWAFGFTDALSTYVAFVSQAAGSATVAKYSITVNGTLVTPPTTINVGAAGVRNIQNVVFREPLAWLAGGGSIAEVDMNEMNVTSVVDVTTTIASVGTISCGAAGTTNLPNILYASTTGVVFSYSTSLGTVGTTFATVAGESFSTACGAKADTYGVFFSASSGMMYQFNFPGTSALSAPAFVVTNIGVGKSISIAITNSDQTGLYLFTYVSSGSIPDTIYEFYLGSSSVDFSSVTQPTSPDEDSFYRNVFAAYLVGSTIYIGTSAANLPRIYQFTIPTTLSRSSNSSSKSLLYADYSLPENPTGVNGKTNSIADVGQTAGNGDILVGNGVASVALPANSSLSIPSRGPIVTYLRGTKSVAPAHGGAANTDAAIALRLVSLDEVTSPVVTGNTTQYPLKRSMPFYSSDIAPWYQKTAIKPDGATVTGSQWEIGITSNLADSAHQYSYLVPPMPQIVNNTVSRPQSSRLANQFTNGYVSFLLQEEVFLQNTSMIQLNNITYNVTTRTFRYAITIDSWQFLSTSNYLRLNLVLGVGPDGNGTLAVFNADGNGTTTNTLLTSYVIVADSAEWTLVLPQNLIQNTGFVNVAAPTVYDPSTNLISIFFPYSVDSANPTKSANQTYTFLLEYSYIAPPLPSASIQDGGGPHLLPLWIVLGVLGGIVIIGIIVAIIVIIVVYRLVWKNQTEYEIRSTFDKTENALDRFQG